MNVKNKNILVIAPHPDDETLGVGGTISRFSGDGAYVYVLIVSGHMPPLYNENDYVITQDESKKAFQILGIKDYKFLDIPATMVNELPVSELNSKISDYVKKIKPEIVFIPFPDRHIDHRVIFDSAMVACRPTGNFFPNIVLSYETLSETHWNAPNIEPNFVPELFINISSSIELKKQALDEYKSQLAGNSSRSTNACLALAKFRGSQNNCDYAEAFKVIRFII
tara:strand:- start:13948 stop:14619 length:672 start_codon:yes stop_codon:yes gene_type:complete